jgi:modulator of FtsH protease HflK
MLATGLLFLYLLSGIFMLENGQSALIIRLGKYAREEPLSGVHFAAPYPFETVHKEYVSRVKKIKIHGTIDMETYQVSDNAKKKGIELFTGDENLIRVTAIISYDVKNLYNYALQVKKPESVIASTAATCINNEIAMMKVDTVMTTGKASLKIYAKEQLQKMLDTMKIGARIISIEFTELSPPSEVSTAFNDVSAARGKKQEIIKESEGYANTVVPRARGEASSLLSEAEAYANERINDARADVKVFNDMLKEYYRNPVITLKHKYLETMQKVFKAARVKIESNPSRSVYYIDD